MDAETFTKLRAPFPASDVGKLPRIICPQCRDARGRACDEHPKQKCRDCGNYITPRHIHLDYVGHAELTDRLLSIDPEWNWEPLGVDPNTGAPAIDGNGGMWITLTIAGVSRIGYGHPDGKKGGDALKETIGDALRNAAMRFGVALDLWRKEAAQLDGAEQPADSPAPSAQRARGGAAAQQQATPTDPAKLREAIARIGKELGWTNDELAEDFSTRCAGTSIREGAVSELQGYLRWLSQQKPKNAEQKPVAA